MNDNHKHIDIRGLLPGYFADEITADERKAVEEWVAADTKNLDEFRAFEKLWNIAGSASDGEYIDLEQEWKIMEKSIEPKVSTIPFVRFVQVAASVILVFSLSYLFLKISQVKTEKAPVAALSTTVLPDGSIVSLNAGSKILYKKGFGTTQRNLILKGEAFFEVQKNEEIPFVITANEAGIVVTGTKFNVKAYKNEPEVRVTVTEGSVKLFETRRPVKETNIRAGETAFYDPKLNIIRKQTFGNLNDIAWKTKVLEFENTRLREVADILENTYHYQIIVDPGIQTCPITVYFKDRDLDYILKLIGSTLDLNISREGRKIFISGKGC